MKRITLFILLLSSVTVLAQKQKTEPIEYFTDSEVNRSIVSVQLGYMPYFSNRRIVANSANPQAGYYFVNSNVTGKYGQAYGADLLFRLNGSFDVGIGVYNSYANYRWDAVKIIDDINGNGDTLGGTYKIDMSAQYINVPIEFGFVSQIADQWYLQVYPALELNFLKKLERTYNIDNPDLQPKDNDAFGDITDIGTDFNLTINFGLGAEYRVVPKIGFFTRLQFRYMFYPIVNEAVAREGLYTVGAHTGVRFYF